ncbi:MAG TPA: GTPase HflX, partial [Actinotalea sp.]|nr:GTPase HflX [Actinotalea sp.]
GQVAAVREVLADIDGIADVRELVVLNKADVADPDTVARMLRREPAAVVVSAHTGAGMDELRERIAAALPRPLEPVELVVPYTRGDLVSRAHGEGDVEGEHLAEGTLVRGRVDGELAAQLRRAAAAG